MRRKDLIEAVLCVLGILIIGLYTILAPPHRPVYNWIGGTEILVGLAVGGKVLMRLRE